MRHNWTEADELLLAKEVMATTELLGELKARDLTMDAYWLMVAGRLWPQVRITGEAARARWSECKEQAQAALRAQEEARASRTSCCVTSEEMAKFDAVWIAAEAKLENCEQELAEATHDTAQEILQLVRENGAMIAALCRAWDVPVDAVQEVLHD